MVKRLLVSLVFVVGLSLSFMPSAQALSIPQPATHFAACGAGLADYLGLEPWYGCLQQKYYRQVGCSQPQGCTDAIRVTTLTDIWLIALPVLEDLIRAGGYIAVGFIFWGGVKYTKSQGNPSETGQALDIIRNAIIGLLWVVLSVAVVEFVTVGIQTGIGGG